MENFNQNNNRINKHILGGVFLIAIGAMFLLKGFGVLIPFWLLSWHTLLLLAGALIGFRRNFRPGGWIVMVLIGSIFTLREVLFFDISAYTTALVLIGLGIYVMFKPRKQKYFYDFSNCKQRVNFDKQQNANE